MSEPEGIRRARAQRILREVIPRARRPERHPVGIEALHVGGEPIGFEQAARGPFQAFEVGEPWGPAWDTTWFRVRGEVPREWRGREVVLVVRLGYSGGTGFGAEALVWRDGEPLQGISPNHDEVIIATSAAGDERVELFIEAAANPPVVRTDPGAMYMPDYGGVPMLRLAACHLAVADREVEALWEDWSLLLELYDQLHPNEPRRARILRHLERAGRALDRDDVAGTAAAARAELRVVLDRPAHATAHRYAAVGNAHIDSAWLWPLRETRRKVARTFSTAIDLMERYPDYRFAASQAQQLSWIREDYPGLYERIQKKVADGQFEVVGSMWVEADCNIPSGESLVRQVAHGKRFFREEFGVDTRSLWLPDVFGYPANLPQILALSGVRWFLTQKISWNQVNHFPHHTFWWQGIDGTRILSHFPPADTYVGTLGVDQLQHGVRNFAEKELSDVSMYLYGWGDGGGGPTRHMLERAHRLADLEGAPRVELCSATEAFEAIEADAPVDELPVWAGELYLEMHRGTYTTHAEVKKGNRRLELALRDAEIWSAAATRLTGATYPDSELDAAWKKLLLHQFHDIIPGSSIHWVYRDTERDYAELTEVTGRLIGQALSALAAAVAVPADLRRPALVFNPLAVARREVIEIEGHPAWVETPACGWAVADAEGGASSTPSDVSPVAAGDGWMSNGLLRAEWDAEGLVTSLVHLATGRDAIAPEGRANLLQVHDDWPMEYDAWDIDAEAFTRGVDLTTADTVEVTESGPLRATVYVARTYLSSRLEQWITLRAGSPSLEVRTVVDWHEPKKLLKAAFPLDVHANHARFEVQFGHLERPTHSNTTWDEARFEVCAHTWADLSEAGFGVALLNDCKYGHDVEGNVLRLTLLRAPIWPDPVADQGRHEMTYALMPHAGHLGEGGVVEAAHSLNSPLAVVPLKSTAGGGLPAAASLVEVDDPGAVVTAVKAADAGNGLVVRLYEAFGGQRRVRVSCPLLGMGSAPTATNAVEVSEVDLLEQPTGRPIEVEDGAAVVTLRPFQIVTLLFR